MFECGSELLEGRRGRRRDASKDEQKVERLEKKLKEKDEVLGGLMAEYVLLKKRLGGI